MFRKRETAVLQWWSWSGPTSKLRTESDASIRVQHTYIINYKNGNVWSQGRWTTSINLITLVNIFKIYIVCKICDFLPFYCIPLFAPLKLAALRQMPNSPNAGCVGPARVWKYIRSTRVYLCFQINLPTSFQYDTAYMLLITIIIYVRRGIFCADWYTMS